MNEKELKEDKQIINKLDYGFFDAGSRRELLQELGLDTKEDNSEGEGK